MISRLHSLATNPTTAVPAVKAAMRGYRASESSARDLISTIWNIFDGNLEHTASIINAFVDLLEEEDKKQDLLASWKGFAVEVRDFEFLLNLWLINALTAATSAIPRVGAYRRRWKLCRNGHRASSECQTLNKGPFFPEIIASCLGPCCTSSQLIFVALRTYILIKQIPSPSSSFIIGRPYYPTTISRPENDTMDFIRRQFGCRYRRQHPTPR